MWLRRAVGDEGEVLDVLVQRRRNTATAYKLMRSHVPIRRRERKQQKFKSEGSAERWLSAHAPIYTLFSTQTSDQPSNSSHVPTPFLGRVERRGPRRLRLGRGAPRLARCEFTCRCQPGSIPSQLQA
jgi:hypothetical protein